MGSETVDPIVEQLVSVVSILQIYNFVPLEPELCMSILPFMTK